MKTEYDFSKGERGKFFRKHAKLRFPSSDGKPDWVGPEGALGKFIVEEAKKTLRSYCAQPHRVTEDANSEQFTAHGGYAHRQLFELVQNSADALLDSSKGKSILIRLTDDFLYCADDGDPIDEDGIVSLMFSRMSSKRNSPAIGRFGLGFKSVLGVTEVPEFFSRPVSFRFDKNSAAERIAKATQDAQAERYPVLRLPDPIDPYEERNRDEELRELMSWATNIVRLPLKAGAHEHLARQVEDFPAEFLLFVDHVRYLTLENGERSREFMLRRRDGELVLDTGEGAARWLRFDTTHSLSAEARADWPLRDDSDDVPVQWAVPFDRLDLPGNFWAFFPTHTASLVAGILNAPWKTNEDRQNLLPGPYNDELIEATATMIAETLPQLSTDDDPARHLDALPRRHEGGDSEQVDLLRKCLFCDLHEREIVPDQDGNLRAIGDLLYPPSELTSDGTDPAPFARWAAYPGRPSNWLHHKALTRNRLAAVDRLHHPEGEPPRWTSSGAPRTDVAEWLQALVEGKEGDEAIRASMAAVQTAATIPFEKRRDKALGNIVLTLDGTWQTPDPECVFLLDKTLDEDGFAGDETYVHPDLASNSETLSALKALGLKPPSPESKFRLIAGRILGSGGGRRPNEDLYRGFWTASRSLSNEAAFGIIRQNKDWKGREVWPMRLRVRTRAGTWELLHSVLLPDGIVPGDGSRDDDATVDTEFHEPDDALFRDLGVTGVPHDGRDLSMEPSFRAFLDLHRKRFTNRLRSNPHSDRLNFETSFGCGPLHVLTRLSEEGRAAYTDALLSMDATYSRWTMRHDTQRHKYPDLPCEPLSLGVLPKEGRIRTSGGEILPFADALGPHPNSPEALHALLAHPKAQEINAAFDLAEPVPEFFGEREPVPLTDIWPGLKAYLPARREHCRLISCDRILVVGEAREYVFYSSDIYLVGAVDDDEQRKLELVADELGLGLGDDRVQAVVQRRTPREVAERRAAIRQRCSTDAERLLAAVDEQALRAGLPDSLLAVLEDDGATQLEPAEVAEAAIATYHTDALRQYKWALDRLDPPSRWAGSARAVRFVRSLGFFSEWAGERGNRRDPFLEIEGPYSLPPLHQYQRTIVKNVRNVLRNEYGGGAERRGMISMPTGSGKTRVAVQAIVEAMREDGFRGGVLWVADREELCEQAVESWRQVWSSVGVETTQLRISRMWEDTRGRFRRATFMSLSPLSRHCMPDSKGGRASMSS